MTDTTLRMIGEFVGSVPTPGSFAACRTGTAENLAIEVAGVGPIRFPVSAAQARQLCEVARPARYGSREQTLLDASVRNTWEIPPDRVTVDERRWQVTLLPMLDILRAELGLAPDCELTAQLHSMLVYEPGQFFQRHQDSEKADGMLGTLVVTLPSEFTGGELVIEQHGTKVTDQGSPHELSFVAFYSDCEHEVLPVIDGFRITLTYNLVAKGRTGPDTAAFATHPSAALLAEQLRAHFTTPVELPTWPSRPEPAMRPPRRLVYLLDHQYSKHGLGWDQLKGADATRAAMMLAAADIAGYDTSLALAEVEDSYEEDYTAWSMIYRQRWERVETGWKCVESADVAFDDDGEMVDPEPDDPASLPVLAELPLTPGSEDIGELRSSTMTLTWQIDRSGPAGKPAVPHVEDVELCTGGPTAAVEPFASEIEGYLGNEGNTAYFWYRRAAIVIRPDQ
ncbi:2OG-Fe(II) oxygenase [Nocardia cyriacigeorgica]|uniref:2OG-Fe(II) oxygenase family protein n=1 Tax=Nocardia cyriacigeorgica TaxID=135487 RepID=UPI001895FC55|nr:2OG-Fe(II) oxygenase [Nocardia cyriacigeorgica]MBF6161548.1 2OG-Fe(II) oxygenase [Nocardia cyriacigeorgica]MBF6200347.1 2OG-Fe(II) oxygenase [Nocardia cyriacigeorgica]MBF6512847.1 2OG-Fe(II) oxygenase [Nocardia cyriacigeorgica]